MRTERCEKAGGKIGTRPDDDPTKFATRWDEFMTRTYPVVEGYRQKGIVHEVDGMPSVEEVHAQIMEVVKSYQ